MVTLVIEPIRATTFEVREGETPGAHSAKAGESIVLRGSPAIEVEIPHVARIRAHGPTEGVVELREKLARVERTLAERVAEGQAYLKTPQLVYRSRPATWIGDRPWSPPVVRKIEIILNPNTDTARIESMSQSGASDNAEILAM